MTAKLSASADGTKVTIGTAAENALQIDATAKTVKALAPYQMNGNGPAFSAYASTDTSFATGPQKINLLGELFDTDGQFANSRFTAVVAGIYQFNFSFQMTLNGAHAVLMKNGVTVVAYGSNSSDATNTTVASSGAQLVQLAAGEYIELFGIGPSIGASTATGQGITYLSGHLVRAAG